EVAARAPGRSQREAPARAPPPSGATKAARKVSGTARAPGTGARRGPARGSGGPPRV
ncbi:unnamed protein product, partial [Prorocentrum cordatum]